MALAFEYFVGHNIDIGSPDMNKGKMKSNINTWTPGAILDCGELCEVFTDDLDLYRFCASHDNQFAGFAIRESFEDGDYACEHVAYYLTIGADGIISASSWTIDVDPEVDAQLRVNILRGRHTVTNIPRDVEIKWWREVFNDCRPEPDNDNMFYRTLQEIEGDLLEDELRDRAQSLIDAIKEKIPN